jgi:hypothetical protein
MALRGERRQEISDVRRPEPRRMTFAMEHEVPPDPDDVRLFGPPAVMAHANRLAHLVEQLDSHGDDDVIVVRGLSRSAIRACREVHDLSALESK